MNKIFRGSGFASPSPEKPKVYVKTDWCVRVFTVIACIPFVLMGYALGVAYATFKGGWKVGRNI